MRDRLPRPDGGLGRSRRYNEGQNSRFGAHNRLIAHLGWPRNRKTSGREVKPGAETVSVERDGLL